VWFDLRPESVSFLGRAPLLHVCEEEVGAPRAAVFAAIAEPRTWSAWFPGVREACYATAPPHGVGTRREARVGATRWVEEMIAWDADVRWAYTVLRSSVPMARAQVESFEVFDSGVGTRVRWTLGFEPRGLGRLGAPLAARAIRSVFGRAMRNLETHLQGRERPW
jgi:hypothetical protein